MRESIRIWDCEHPCSIAQLCLTLCHPMDCSPPGFSVDGISQARILEWVATSYSRGSSWPRQQTRVSWLAGGFLTNGLPGKSRRKNLNSGPANLQGLCCLTLFFVYTGVGYKKSIRFRNSAWPLPRACCNTGGMRRKRSGPGHLCLRHTETVLSTMFLTPSVCRFYFHTNNQVSKVLDRGLVSNNSTQFWISSAALHLMFYDWTSPRHWRCT